MVKNKNKKKNSYSLAREIQAAVQSGYSQAEGSEPNVPSGFACGTGMVSMVTKLNEVCADQNQTLVEQPERQS